jgi:hypothetical protein
MQLLLVYLFHEPQPLSLVALGCFLLLGATYVHRRRLRQNPHQTARAVLAQAPSVTAQLLAARAMERDSRRASGRAPRAADPLTVDEVLAKKPPAPVLLSWADINTQFATDEELIYCLGAAFRTCGHRLLDDREVQQFWTIHDEMQRRAAVGGGLHIC